MGDSSRNQGSAATDGFFLPDFCRVRRVFAVVVVAELLAFLLVLADADFSERTWSDLGITSLFVQWTALSCAGVLCLLRGRMERLAPRSAGLISYLLLLLVIALFSELAYRLTGPLGLEQATRDHALFTLRNLLLGALVAGMVLRYFYVRHQWEQQVQAEARARVEALAARIRPHFLFNSLSTIASLTRSDPALAEELVQDLADLFRVAMRDVEARITLGEELQPLLENAVYHGIEASASGGRLGIIATCNRGVLRLEVRNPLPPDGATPHADGNRMALANIRERLALAFGPGARLQTEIREGEYRVRLLFPLEEAP